MLILSRQKDESIFIYPPGSSPIKIKIVDQAGGNIRLGIEASPEITILRSELLNNRKREEE